MHDESQLCAPGEESPPRGQMQPEKEAVIAQKIGSQKGRTHGHSREDARLHAIDPRVMEEVRGKDGRRVEIADVLTQEKIRSQIQTMVLFEGELFKYKPGMSISYISRWCQVTRGQFMYFSNHWGANCWLRKPIMMIPLRCIKAAQRVLISVDNSRKTREWQLTRRKAKAKVLGDFQLEIFLKDDVDVASLSHFNELKMRDEDIQISQSQSRALSASRSGEPEAAYKPQGKSRQSPAEERQEENSRTAPPPIADTNYPAAAKEPETKVEAQNEVADGENVGAIEALAVKDKEKEEPDTIEVKVEEVKNSEEIVDVPAREPTPAHPAATEIVPDSKPHGEDEHNRSLPLHTEQKVDSEGHVTSVIEIESVRKHSSSAHYFYNGSSANNELGEGPLLGLHPVAKARSNPRPSSRDLPAIQPGKDVLPGHLMKSPYSKLTSRRHSSARGKSPPLENPMPSTQPHPSWAGGELRFQDRREQEEYCKYEGEHEAELKSVTARGDTGVRIPSGWVPSLSSMR